MKPFFSQPFRRSRPTFARTLALVVGAWTIAINTDVATATEVACEDGATVASGEPDRDLLSHETSRGIRAFWCERYDADGNATRFGPYREFYPSGRLRTSGHYVESRLEGPIAIQHENGSLFLRGFLTHGDWNGPFEIFHESGAVWFEAKFQSGRLEGPLRTRYPDGALESETQYQAGREDGLARSFYPTAVGGRLKSEAHVEADEFVGVHRLLARDGALVRSIDWSSGPPIWTRLPSLPAAQAFGLALDSALHSVPKDVSDPETDPSTDAKSTVRD